MEYSIGIDVGGTKIELALIDRDGNVKEPLRIRTQVDKGYDAIENDIVNSIKTLQNLSPTPIHGIGVGIPGQVQDKTGVINFAPNLKWENIPFRSHLEQKTQLPVIITNDVRAAAWGEWLNGAGKNCKNMVCLFIGTGIGGGIVTEGQMLQGFTHCAGELGHTIVQMNGPLCSCGNRGCLEALASGWAIATQTKERILKNPKRGKNILELCEGKLELLSTVNVVQAYLQEDPLAQEVIQEALKALVVGCVSICNAFNPERLILGGGVIRGLPYAVEYIQKEIKKHALKAATEVVTIIPAKFLRDAGVVGAGALAWNSFK